MEKSSRIVGTLSLVAAVCMVSILIGTRPARVASPLPQQNDPTPTKVQDLKIQKLTGDAARLRAKQLRKLNKGVARAMRDAEKKGLREAFNQGAVVLATDAAKTASLFARTPAGNNRKTSFGFPHQDPFSDGDYEVSFFPYDDGDPNTWEGIIYRNGPDIDEDTRSTILNVSTDEPQVIQETYYPRDGGDPCSTGEGPRCYDQIASMSNGSGANRNPSQGL